MDSQSDSKKFRNALGQFATGVTIITTMGKDDKPVGITVNSFSAVSLEPPLVLWSLAKTALSFSSFNHAGHFNVHVLTSEQDSLSNRFARSGIDKFTGVEYRKGITGMPILNEYAVCFQCKTSLQYEGGDHVIFVGEVIDFDQTNKPPLVFHSGQYVDTKDRGIVNSEDLSSTVNVDYGIYRGDFFLYLLGRAYYQMYHPIVQAMEKAHINEPAFFSMSVLCMGNSLTTQQLRHILEHTGKIPTQKDFNTMAERGLIIITHAGDAQMVTISDYGRRVFSSLLSVAQTQEEDTLIGFNAGDLSITKKVLKDIVEKTNPGIPTFINQE